LADAPAERYDAVVVGSGVAGALIAWKLAEVGRNVLILEAGEQGPSRAELVKKYAAATNKSLGSPYVASEPAKIPGPEQYGGKANPPPASVRDEYYDQGDRTEKYLSTYERRVGGTTWHWLGHTPRLLPNDFNLKSLYGVGVDWPLSYDDLEPWYCAAEEALGVAGDDAQWTNVHGAFRSKPFPMPPIWTSFSDDYIIQRVDGRPILGLPIHIRATPAARNSLPYDDRPPCAGNASCIPICPIGAKYDASFHVEKARKAGATLRAKSVVTKLHVEGDGAVHRVTYRTWDGAEQTVFGNLVIVAANAIETPKLLLLSNDALESGVANSSDQVGRNLMDHLQKSVFAKLADPVYPFRGPPSTAGIEEFRDGPVRRQSGAFRISLDNDGWYSKSSPYTEAEQLVQQGLFGSALQQSLRDAVLKQCRFSCSTEVLADPNNCVTLSKRLDSSGIRRPELTFAAAKYTLDAIDRALEAIAEITALAGGTICAIGKISGAGHILGTCRMGSDRTTAVVDANCRSFDHPTLYIAGSSTFPTCGTANPTLTIAALALRTADHIIRTNA
jgi:glucose dehydrogenase